MCQISIASTAPICRQPIRRVTSKDSMHWQGTINDAVEPHCGPKRIGLKAPVRLTMCSCSGDVAAGNKLTCTVTLSNGGNIGLTGATTTIGSSAGSSLAACPTVALQPGASAAGCNVGVTSTTDDFEQGGMWFNVTAEATSNADQAPAVTSAKNYQTLVQWRKLKVALEAYPSTISSPGI